MPAKKNTNSYDAKSIEVLRGLEPVQRRPGMYTDTSHPNHLAHEAIDNSIDEAIAGYATEIEVIHHKDGSLTVSDNGRGMPTDVHPEHKMTGVELIMTRLHAGAKFSNENYTFSGGLHGVGISVVNALSSRLEVTVKQKGHIYSMSFHDGIPDGRLKSTGSCGQRNTGTTIRFWPEKSYFDTANFQLKALKNTLRAKAVLCSGLHINFTDEVKKRLKNGTMKTV